jgi:hypothetical protein
MTSLTRQFALLLCVAASTSAFAQAPRPPLGPGDVSRQFPQGLQQQAPAPDSITVTNLGDSLLQLSYWDGAEWKPFQLSSRQAVSISISCSKCGNEIPIAFHDGTSNRTTKAQTGTNYGLFWDQTRLRWDFAPLAVIMQNRGRFR